MTDAIKASPESRKKKRPSVDSKSYELAQHFLQDSIHTEDDEWELAGDIQRAAEDWFLCNVRAEK